MRSQNTSLRCWFNLNYANLGRKTKSLFWNHRVFFLAVVFFVVFSQFIFERPETQAMDIPKILEKKDTFHSMMNKIFPWMKK